MNGPTSDSDFRNAMLTTTGHAPEVIESGDLAALPTMIDAAVADVKAHASGMVEAAVRAGHLLLQAKATVHHGDWEAWLTTNCVIAPRTARAYMRLAEKLSELPAPERQRVAVMPLREAIKAISTTAEAPARCTSTYRLDRLQRDRVQVGLKKSADALRALTRDVKNGFVKRKQIESTRSKLQAALAALDDLQANDSFVEVASHG